MKVLHCIPGKNQIEYDRVSQRFQVVCAKVAKGSINKNVQGCASAKSNKFDGSMSAHLESGDTSKSRNDSQGLFANLHARRCGAKGCERSRGHHQDEAYHSVRGLVPHWFQVRYQLSTAYSCLSAQGVLRFSKGRPKEWNNRI